MAVTTMLTRERRIARLERRAAQARFDPAAVCRTAAGCYANGLPLPAN
jgi:hypothetical protein